ncbi:methylglyoxal synthase [Hyphobacterium sp. CCMP332]|nr:methylglyoxal synthase [Hyphobacterium sp. CCMP332]
MKYKTALLPAIKNIALVAHDNRKKDLLDWAYFNRDSLKKHQLFATGTTGSLLEEKLNQPITKFLSGPLGGDQQLGAKITEDEINCLIFFWDPLSSQPHDPDVKALVRIATVWNIPMACNRCTADFLLSSPLMDENVNRIQPDYSDYMNRNIDTE